jgi:tol-pal system protein YbgF
MRSILSTTIRTCIVLMVIFGCTATPTKKDLSTSDEKPFEKMTRSEQDLYGRIMRMSMSVREATIVLWLPEHFFRFVASTNPSTNPIELERNLQTLRPYTLILAAAAKIEDGKEVQWCTEFELRKGIQLRDNREALHEPLAQDALNPEAGALVEIFSAGMRLHTLRENKPNPPKLYCFTFQKNGKAVVNPNDRGRFSIVLRGFEHRFETPIPLQGEMARPQTASIQPEPKQPPPPPQERDQFFNEAASAFRQAKYDNALLGFTDSLRKYPNSGYCDEANFWIGECHMAMKNSERAILAYQKVIKDFPSSTWVPRALLRQGDGFLNIDDRSSYELLMKKIIKLFPNSVEAETARNRLR